MPRNYGGASLLPSVLAAMLAMSPAWGAATVYGYDLPKRLPKLHQLWVRALPAEFRREPLFRDFAGTASPVKWVSIEGRRELYVSSCQPHLCDVRRVDALISPADGHAAGLVTTPVDGDLSNAVAHGVGALREGELRFLKAKVLPGAN